MNTSHAPIACALAATAVALSACGAMSGGSMTTTPMSGASTSGSSMSGSSMSGSSMPGASMPNAGGMARFSQDALPDPVKVPAGHRVAMETQGSGEIAYECRERTDAAGQFGWAFVGPDARLMDRSGKVVGRYYGPPATWELMDGSKATATQVASAPAGMDNIPFQLVKANPAIGMGQMQGVSYIQRVATRGGIAPGMPCAASTKGARQMVKYQADYIFWKAG